MIALIDNYDSFTYNLVQYFGELGAEIKVFLNDEIKVEEIEQLNPEALVISPGPGRPEDAGISMEAIKKLGPKIPTLGICLGHQCIGEIYGGRVSHAKEILHGKTSLIRHSGHPLFDQVSNPFKATRYHSLIVEEMNLPIELDPIATTEDGTLMAVAHKEYPVFGLQFHPESVFTNVGMHILDNFLKIVSKNNSGS
ncbi:aminodeoxychorismate/anthranilate synthase component II [Candidatus Marinimicrobia bacterium MT.SAG.2]|nr:aminodeoxychorismate/anthranilate synthase component II [Candidatus Marinimicrobia bacterium MT.SAG.2]